jgi:hypothetical protein
VHPVRLEIDEKALVASTSGVQNARYRAVTLEQRTRVAWVGAVAHHRRSAHTKQSQLRCKALPVAHHVAAARGQ